MYLDDVTRAEKAAEIRDYVTKVQQYRQEFALKSKANPAAKNKKPKKTKKTSKSGSWVTLPDGRKVRIDK